MLRKQQVLKQLIPDSIRLYNPSLFALMTIGTKVIPALEQACASRYRNEARSRSQLKGRYVPQFSWLDSADDIGFARHLFILSTNTAGVLITRESYFVSTMADLSEAVP